jgi:hypothetical protein
MGKVTKLNYLKKQAMLSALEKHLGNVTLAAREVGIIRKTHYDWMNADAEYKAKVEELFDVALDFAEAKLMELVEEKNITAVIYYLNNKGRVRGYNRKHEEEDVDKTVNIVINSPLSNPE